MKKINLTLIMICTMFATSLFSQNTFPTGAGTSVGIGTLTPYTKLHVASGVITVSGSNAYGGPQIVLGPTATSNNIWGIETMTAGLNFWRPGIGSQANQGNYFLFLKNSNGFVGIKTDNPTANLTVNGNVLIGNPATVNLPAGYKLYVETGILTEKVKVAVKNTANWSDYVFAKNYKMLPLTEVEAYVNKHKHLPGVPSAEEVVANGIDVATMDAKLLEKIEELTLYVIKLEKEMNELKQKH